MPKKKVLKFDDIASLISTKSISLEKFKWGELVFEVGSLTEKEILYMLEETSKGKTEVEAQYIGMHISIAFGVKKLFKVDDDKLVEVKVDKDTISVMGDEVEAIPMEIVSDWDFALKTALSQKIASISSFTEGEGKKLELFR